MDGAPIGVSGVTVRIWSVLRQAGWPTPEDNTGHPETVSERLNDEADLIVQCVQWLTQLDDPDGPLAGPIINLRPDQDRPQTLNGRVDRERVIRILRRIASDIEELARARTLNDTTFAAEETEPLQRVRRRYSEPDIPRPTGPMSIPQSRRAWDRYEKAIRQAGLTPPPNPYRHLEGTYTDPDPRPHRSRN